MKRKFLLPSLLAAGFTGGLTEPAIAAAPEVNPDVDPPLVGFFRQQHTYTLAAHGSHSSHGSHGSHSSHRSSSGGGTPTPRYTAPAPAPAPRYTAPAPAPSYTPPTSQNSDSTPPASILPSPPRVAPRVLPGNSATFINIAMQVQTALYAYGYYTGPIDGIIGAESRSALSRFQSDFGLPVTGTITPEVLDAFGITAN